MCRRGAQHYFVLAVNGARALCVPVIFNRTFIHRADVSVWGGKREKFLRLAGSTVVRCTDHRWHSNAWDSNAWDSNAWDSRIMQASPATIRKILASFGRDLEAQAIEAGGSGLYQSVLARGPKLGDCGRKKGGSPSD
ncbi:hypothetical protein HKD32_02545 [Gluconobacter japonicus]|uniref:Uncharacterized protein n=1 Tax=Gluconobacter japonicus TaxID=376620 RepID=A0A9Q2FJN3_GLUJA|nr:hypothetical protein [Gluconobacter japonicus]